jgi:DegV family protein with EDD domain
MVNIITDSTADLGMELSERANVQVIPLYVNLGSSTYQDGRDISPSQLFSSIESAGQMPKTSAPTLADFIHAFDLNSQNLYIGISGRLSATIQNAYLARENYPQQAVFIVDSANLSGGIGLLVLKAADLRNQGLSAQEIHQMISAWVPRVRTSFIVETLDYLYKGGRCTAVQHLMGSLLQIRPVIALRPDGTLGVKTKVRGTRRKAIQALLDDFQENLAKVNLERVIISHTGCVEDAGFLKQELLKLAPVQEILIVHAGVVIASHCGPNTLGLSYLLN